MGGFDETIREECRAALLQWMERLAAGKVNDAVKLAFLDNEQIDAIDALDLSALTEFKRNHNGTVEIKLTDRLTVLERLISLLNCGGSNQAVALYQALEKGAALPQDPSPQIKED